MDYISTRDKTARVSAARAIAQGISAEGGLFVPEKFPQVSLEEIGELAKMDYAGRAKNILGRYLTDFTAEELQNCIDGAYGSGFDTEDIAPTVKLGDFGYILELWHGPTSAFKDMALQLLPHLVTVSAKKTCGGKKIVILVATSGDTGKAALEGFKNVPDTEMIVFYPENGVSPMQKLQMATQEGDNLHVCGIKGNFDDAQSGVKEIFTGPMNQLLEQHGMMYSSANSINWGRLAPQIVYYFSTYCDLLQAEEIKLGDPINVVVPTGNFGNILAAYYAKKMGLPIAKLICASNQNNVLTDFFKDGCYDRRREFYVTISPSMDILISSNLERLLFDLCGNDDRQLSGLMEQLKANGSYTIPAGMLEKAKEHFYAGCCDDAQTKQTIHEMFEKYGYLCDTHTAVAVKVYEDYRQTTNDLTKTVIASTANPYKFSASVLEAVTGGKSSADEFDLVAQLERASKCPVPENLANIKNKTVRFTDVCGKNELEGYVKGILGLQ